MKKAQVPPGTKFGRWTVLREGPRNRHGNRQHVCQCKCGAISTISQAALRCGKSRGCGECAAGERGAKRRMLTLTLCLSDWARLLGISPPALCKRLSRGWSLQRALSEKKTIR